MHQVSSEGGFALPVGPVRSLMVWRLSAVLIILLTLTSGCGPKVDHVAWSVEPVVELPWRFNWEAEWGRGRLLWLSSSKAAEEGRTELVLSSLDCETGETVRWHTFETEFWKQDVNGFLHPLLDGESCAWFIHGIVQDNETPVNSAFDPTAGPADTPVPTPAYREEYATAVVFVTPTHPEPLVLRFPYRVWCGGVSDRYVVLESTYESRSVDGSNKRTIFALTLVDVVAGTVESTMEFTNSVSIWGFTTYKGQRCMALKDGFRLSLLSVDSGEEVVRFNLGDTRVDPKTGEGAAGYPIGVVFAKDGEYFVVEYYSDSSGWAIAKVLMDGAVVWVRPGGGLEVSENGEWIFTTTGTEVPFAEIWTVRAFSKDRNLLAKTSYTTSGQRWGAQYGTWEKGLWWVVPGNRETGWKVEWLDLTTDRPTLNSTAVPHESGLPRLSYDGKFIFDDNRTVYKVIPRPE
ncbi:MAG: hypothetical protein ACM3WU_09655 [Bacillota bacterium]